MNFHLIAALDNAGGIGKASSIPWNLKTDRRFFRAITTSNSLRKTLDTFDLKMQSNFPTGLVTDDSQNCVIMGRATWDSLPDTYKPLPSRLNIVLTRQSLKFKGAFASASFDYALKLAEERKCAHCFVIGGAQIYKEAIGHQGCLSLILTIVTTDMGCDVFFPPYPPEFKQYSRSINHVDNGIEYYFKLMIAQTGD